MDERSYQRSNEGRLISRLLSGLKPPRPTLERNVSAPNLSSRLSLPRRRAATSNQVHTMPTSTSTPSLIPSPSPLADSFATENRDKVLWQLVGFLTEPCLKLFPVLFQDVSSAHLSEGFYDFYSTTSLALPTVSAAGLCRVFSALEWLSSQHHLETPETNSSAIYDQYFLGTSEEGVWFSLFGVLQGVIDISSLECLARGADLILGRSGTGILGWKQLFIHSDYRKHTIAFFFIFKTLCNHLQAQHTLHVHFVPDPQTEISDENGPTKSAGNLKIRFAILPNISEGGFTESPFTSPFELSVLSIFGITLTHPSVNSWTLEAPIPCYVNPPSSVADADTPAGEPSFEELRKFSEESLKGMKVTLYASESKPFPRHLTSYLADWMMQVTHQSIDKEDTDAGSTTGQIPTEQWARSKLVDSPVRLQTLESPSSEKPDPTSSAATASTNSETPSHIIIIDDDLTSLKRVIALVRQHIPALLAKRPQLTTRRTRSNKQLYSMASTPVIYFIPLYRYRALKEFLEESLASKVPMPDVFVVPKPAGPHRILTSLWTVLKRPVLDFSLQPLGSSASSIPSNIYSPQSSPSSHHEFDLVSENQHPVRTPPVPAQFPKSPLGQISDNQASYFTNAVENMEGTTPSEGMVIQSPDGRNAIFFQPKNSRINLRSPPESNDNVSKDLSPDPVDPVPFSPLYAIGQNLRSRTASNMSSPTNDRSPNHATSALRLDILIAHSRGESLENLGEADAAPTSIPSKMVTPVNSTSSPAPTHSLNTSRNVSGTSPRPPLGPTSQTSPTDVAATKQRETANTVAAGTPPSAPTSRKPSAPKITKKTRTPKAETVPPIKVLIVEDNPINQMIMSSFLRKNGVSFDVAKDGEEAVKKWKEGNFHLVLMDIQLPVKDGIQATREIRELERENNIGTFITTPPTEANNPLPSKRVMANNTSSTSEWIPTNRMPVIIVALTASSLQKDRVNALAAGCNDFLTKPVNHTWLKQKLLEWGSMAYLSGFGGWSSDPNCVEPSSMLEPAASRKFKAKARSNSKTANMTLRIERPKSNNAVKRNAEPEKQDTQDMGLGGS